MRGCHERMSDVWLPDRPLTVHEVYASLSVLESDWSGIIEKDLQL